MATYRSVYIKLDRDERIALEVALARHQATGYVWGRQDSGDTGAGDSMEFGRVYGEARREYLTEQRHWLPNIRDAYQQWLTTGEIEQ